MTAERRSEGRFSGNVAFSDGETHLSRRRSPSERGFVLHGEKSNG